MDKSAPLPPRSQTRPFLTSSCLTALGREEATEGSGESSVRGRLFAIGKPDALADGALVEETPTGLSAVWTLLGADREHFAKYPEHASGERPAPDSVCKASFAIRGAAQ